MERYILGYVDLLVAPDSPARPDSGLEGAIDVRSSMEEIIVSAAGKIEQCPRS